MPYSLEQIEAISEPLRVSLGDNITWQYDKKFNGMLSEFAQNKSDVVLENLKPHLIDEWDNKSAKRLPKALKEQLGDLAKISKNQKILAAPATEELPAMVALWWPWGHGGTYSLRILLLEHSYSNEILEEPPLFQRIIRSLFGR